MARLEIIRVPDLGDFADVDIIDVLVEVGTTVALEDALVTLETDKATMDVPASVAGKITQVLVAIGGKISVGDGVVEVEVDEGAVASADAEAPAATTDSASASARTAAQPPATAAPQASARASTRAVRPAALRPIDEGTFRQAHASPTVRKFARELGVDLGRVTGTGQKQRITREDIQAHVKSVLGQGGAAGSALPAVARVDFAKFGEIEIKPLSRIQKISGPRLHAAWVNIPHVFQMDEADVTELEKIRKDRKGEALARGIRLTSLAFILRAVVLALQEFPQINASLDPDGAGLVYKKYCNLGFAADTPNGLMVPVIHDADHKDVFELARELGVLSARARDGKLKIDEMTGGTFTISSLGGIGGTAFTPIINAPEVGILGVARSRMQAVYQDGEFVPRLMLPFTLSYDHRVIDGATAVRFTSYLAAALADVHRLLEATP